jgi:hypothetical protein
LPVKRTGDGLLNFSFAVYKDEVGDVAFVKSDNGLPSLSVANRCKEPSSTLNRDTVFDGGQGQWTEQRGYLFQNCYSIDLVPGLGSQISIEVIGPNSDLASRRLAESDNQDRHHVVESRKRDLFSVEVNYSKVGKRGRPADYGNQQQEKKDRPALRIQEFSPSTAGLVRRRQGNGKGYRPQSIR